MCAVLFVLKICGSVVDRLFNVLLIVCGSSVFAFALLCITLYVGTVYATYIHML